MKCKRKGCDGEVDMESKHPVQTGCRRFSSTYPCKKCGLLHSDNGWPLENRTTGRLAFLINGERIDRKVKLKKEAK